MNKLITIIIILFGGFVGFVVGVEYQKGWHTRTDLNLFCGQIGKQYLELVKKEKDITSFDSGGDWEKAVEIETNLVTLCNS